MQTPLNQNGPIDSSDTDVVTARMTRAAALRAQKDAEVEGFEQSDLWSGPVSEESKGEAEDAGKSPMYRRKGRTRPTGPVSWPAIRERRHLPTDLRGSSDGAAVPEPTRRAESPHEATQNSSGHVEPFDAPSREERPGLSAARRPRRAVRPPAMVPVTLTVPAKGKAKARPTTAADALPNEVSSGDDAVSALAVKRKKGVASFYAKAPRPTTRKAKARAKAAMRPLPGVTRGPRTAAKRPTGGKEASGPLTRPGAKRSTRIPPSQSRSTAVLSSPSGRSESEEERNAAQAPQDTSLADYELDEEMVW